MTVLNVQGYFEQDPSYTQNCVKKKWKIEFKLEKLLGFRNMQDKLEKARKSLNY